MSEENDKIRYEQLKGIIAGSHSTGNVVSNELKISDAKRHLANLVRKRPKLDLDGSIAKAKKEAEAKAKEAKKNA